MGKYSFTVEDDVDGLSYNFRTPVCSVVVFFNPHAYGEYLEKYTFLSKNTWGLSIFSVPHICDNHYSADVRIRNTIISIIEDFFEGQGSDSVLLYHCDSADGKQGKRSKKFERWYQNSGLTDTMEKHEIEFTVESDSDESQQNYFGFIGVKSNPHFTEVKNEFDEFARSLAFLDK
ncbi:DUF6169 family protein [Taibaiella soli]|uniref:Uncharacterized protein n=1 Tax=Taibaiella soli TaxID=1649169 RepID=A0A2W2AWL2_9BACT|nr:DUF6169 family protein [Taibaiella soli]PZF72364.1 hypothetical protein DN068_13500 [Taibaiella soli]